MSLLDKIREHCHKHYERSLLKDIKVYDRMIKEVSDLENGERAVVESLYLLRRRAVRKYELFSGKKFTAGVDLL